MQFFKTAFEMKFTIKIVNGIFDFPITLSNYKLSDYVIGSNLIENTWSFKPITFEESVIL